MKVLKRLSCFAACFVLLALAGCGGTSGNTTSTMDNPFSSAPNEATTGTPSGSGTVLNYNLALSTTATDGTSTTVGPNGKVIATASLNDSNGNAVSNQPIKFEAIIGPATINPDVVNTDSNGKAINLITAGSSTTSAVDVVIKASTSVNGQLVTSIGIFKIMRSGSNIIKFITTKNTTDPDGTLNTLSTTVVLQATPSSRTILQLAPFQVLDSNGFPVSRVPVTVSIYSEIGDCPVFIDSPETTSKTVTTDDTGTGIFNAGVTVDMPPIGSENSCSIIYKAEAKDQNDPTKTIYSYGGFIAVLKNTLQQ